MTTPAGVARPNRVGATRLRRLSSAGALRLACVVLVTALALASASSGASGAATSGAPGGTVTPSGTYRTSVNIAVPPAPGAPAVSLQYDSSAGLGIAGVGWDLSVGWPTLIARDTRFGTPAWRYDSSWTWGGSPLVAETACTGSGPCAYRTAPDTLARVRIDLRSGVQSATVSYPNGIELTYAPIRYDGVGYPGVSAETSVFGFLLRQAKSSNGYLTCFVNTHHANNTTEGRVAVLSEIWYGPALKDCDKWPASELLHRIAFSYVKPTTQGYFAPMSYRMGAPVSFDNLLESIVVYAAGESAQVEQARYTLGHESPATVETRLPRLATIVQSTPLTGPLKQAPTKERVLRRFFYGERNLGYVDPSILDLGANGASLPDSLSGSETRPVRTPYVAGVKSPPGGVLANGYDLFGGGEDQNNGAAPASHLVRSQWGMSDINGDGLLDVVVADERGRKTGGGNPCPAGGRTESGYEWATFERCDGPGLRPPQQWAYVNEGVKDGALGTSRVVLATDAPALRTDRDPTPGDWIWLEGRGQGRTGMPTSVTSPEVRDGGKCPPLPLQDTRKWPYLPDGSFGGSEGSVGQRLAEVGALARAVKGGFSGFSAVAGIIRAIKGGYIPKDSVSASLSNWVDWNADGVPDWVVTPGMLLRYEGGLFCPHVEPTFIDPNTKQASTDWYVAHGSVKPGPNGHSTLNATKVAGPPGPVPLPIDFAIDSGQAAEWGLTIPVGSIVGGAVATVVNGFDVSSALGLAAIVGEGFVPNAVGVSGSVMPSVPSVSATRDLAKAAVTRGDGNPGQLAHAGAGFVMSSFGVKLDVTLKSGGREGRNQSRSTLADFNADGYPDYLLYDSVGLPGTQGPGGVLLYLNDGKGGFGGPMPVNAGSSYSTLPDLKGLARSSEDAMTAAALATPLAFVCSAGHTSLEPFSKAALLIAGCGGLGGVAAIVSANTLATADGADNFLQQSTDALPGDKGHPGEARVLVVALAAAAASAWIPGPFAFVAAEAADHTAQTARLVAHTTKQLAYPSRLNAINKGRSHTEGGWFGATVGGISVQTVGLVDLNGDSLPDKIITVDREKGCAVDEWAVYWGTGTANLASGRGFSAAPTCVKVPPSPKPVSDRGHATLPLQVDFSTVELPGPLGGDTTTRTYTFVTLLDWNQDGRPDLVVVDGDTFSPTATGRTWRVFLNNGRGFDLTPVPLPSPGGKLDCVQRTKSPGAHPTLDVAYPGLKSNVTGDDIGRSAVDAGFLDVDGDGNADVAQRVLHSERKSDGSCSEPSRAGIMYWSRAGSAPQDLLVDERDPIAGSRTLVRYAPASHFQWPDGTPTGQTPPGVHWAAIGTSAYLVKSVVSEPMIGRAERRTSIGYDYKDPHFDPSAREFTGFARVIERPLDPATGKHLAGTATITYGSQREHGTAGPTLTRVVETATGTPVSETLTGQVAVRTAGTTTARTQAHYAAPNDRITVEFPHGLTKPPLLDVGFDGQRPLANRADREAPDPVTSANAVTPKRLRYDAELPTGGGATFDGEQWASFTSPHPQSASGIAEVTVEAWLQPELTERGTVARLGNSYELTVEPVTQWDWLPEVVFSVNTSQGWIRVRRRVFTEDSRWAHVAASYDGSKVRIFVNGVRTPEVAATGTLPSAGRLEVGCSYDASSQLRVACYRGAIGELRIYTQAWTSPARITRARTKYALDPVAPSFGLPVETRDYGDVSTLSDDVLEETTYGAPQGTSHVRNAVATKSRRELGWDGLPGGYLGYSETRYDERPLGQVTAGNPTTSSVYSGRAPVDARPDADTSTKTRYTDPRCPGIATEAEDPLGAVTTTRYDATCMFALSVTNALGHTETNEYYGVGQTLYADAVVAGLSGQYGELAAATDANGATTRTGYDQWGRPTATVGPYHTRKGAETATEYRDARCVDATAAPVACAEPKARLDEPARTKVSTWDETQSAYRVAYTFSDGQAQRQAINKGTDAWIASGVSDFDALGRLTRAYKPRFFPSACPAAGTWCADPALRAGVLYVQTEYDDRSRIVRTSKFGAAAATRFEYPSPGVTRTIDARGAASITRRDVRGRTTAAEEYVRPSTSPYSTAKYEYDRDGRVIAITDSAANTISTTYDALGRKTTTTDPDLGTWKYDYDDAGRLVMHTDGAGAVARHTYDLLGRITKTRFHLGVPTTAVARSYSFDGGSDDSQARDPIEMGAGLWRVGPQFENQQHFSPIDYEWDSTVELRPLPLSAGDADDGVAALPLPFDFALTPNHTWARTSDGRKTVSPVPGKNLFPAGTTLYVSTNGKIRFDPGGATDTAKPPASRPRLPILNYETGLYVLWNDLVMSGISFAVEGASPNRRLIVQWDGAFASNPLLPIVFRAILFEHSNEVRYVYATLPWFGSNDSTIGIQNHATTPDAVGVEDASPWGNHMVVDGGGQEAFSSRRTKVAWYADENEVLQFNDGSSYTTGHEVAAGRASFTIDVSDATTAELSFRHSWNTRCGSFPRGQCLVDKMRVEAAQPGAPPVVLLSHAELTAQDSLNAGHPRMSQAPTVSAELPRRLLGDGPITISFVFDSVHAADEPRYGWFIDDLRLRTTTQAVEEVGTREYDSSELAPDAGSQPIVDLTFDVPNRIVDRSPLRTRVTAVGAAPVTGISGHGVDLDGTAAVEVSTSGMTPLADALTAQAWVKPASPSAAGTILAQRETFGLHRSADGKLNCWVVAGGDVIEATSSTVIPADVWTHVAMTYDGNALRCYLNGAEDGMATPQTQGPRSVDWSGYSIHVGYERWHGFLSAAFDEVRVFATVRSAGEILADAVSPLRHGPPRGNVLDLGFPDPATPETDSSGAGNDAVHLAAVQEPGVQGNALDFSTSPTGQSVVVPSSPSLQSNVLTAEVWAKTRTTEDRLLVGKWNPPHPGWRLALNRRSGQVRFEVMTTEPNLGTWGQWTGDTRGKPALAKGSCAATANAPALQRKWVSPVDDFVTFSTARGAAWDTVLVIEDSAGNEVGCNDNAAGHPQAAVTVAVKQGATYNVYVTGAGTASGEFTVGVLGLPTVSTEFVTYEKVNDGRWHHLAGTYDGKSLRVYIDGKRALRTCEAEEGAGPVTCGGLPPAKCADTVHTVQVGETKLKLSDRACVEGSIANLEPLLGGAYDPSGDSLEGMLDEIQISNYAKRDWEVAASARPASAYTFALGRPVIVRGQFAEEQPRYDLLGRAVNVVKAVRGLKNGAPSLSVDTYVTRSAFDNLGRVTSTRYPDGEVTLTDFDAAGTQVGLTGYGDFFGHGDVYGRQHYLNGVDLTAAGLVERIVFGNGVETTLEYDDKPNPTASFDEFLARQLTTLPTRPTPTPLQDQRYTYDEVGNVRTRTDAVSTLHGAPLFGTYTYDDLGRLETFETKLGGTVASGSYQYDALGNLRVKEGATLAYAGPATCGSAGSRPLPHAVKSTSSGGATTTYCYDANGSVSEIRAPGGTTTLEHNARGKLRSLAGPNGSFRFHYDGDGARVHKVGPAGTTTEVFPFYRVTPTGVEKYYFAAGRRIARRAGVKPEDVAWYHPDHLGGANLMTNADGAELQDAYSEYTPFGSALPTTANNTAGPYQNKPTPDRTVNRSGGYQFTGKELDETGLYDYGARYYDPAIGRFLEADTVLPGEFPQALNRYSYVYNNPLKFVDPDGHEPQVLHMDELHIEGLSYSDPPLVSLETVENEWSAWPYPEWAYLWHGKDAFDTPVPDEFLFEHMWIETRNMEFGMASDYVDGWGTEFDKQLLVDDLKRGNLDRALAAKVTSHVDYGREREAPSPGKIGGKGDFDPRAGFYVTRISGPPGFTRRLESIEIGQPLGLYGSNNNCQTFALDRLRAAGAVNLPERFTVGRSMKILLENAREYYFPPKGND